jgi:hypothetical protein
MLELAIEIRGYFKERGSSFIYGIGCIYRLSFDLRVGSKKPLGILAQG